ncbi:hypothetical protein BJF93_07020 [Xaviernesmea oryzae]|uniref:Uncharacterized protein n=1 Tax=Xaviernesmea oryzae TaxID=464029 RepID=A0A1Q9ASQ8_9HYPH|nr:hypothetical protein [Xaviernesmea oryzae]OLP58345.1 hypothetical protein BJF93_07020 [Xaviernesmea oryzae]SEL41081.1 hypothetical protein SAMN04487976_10810 [Xaviernesmea oryzae]
MSLRVFTGLYHLLWTLESHSQQRLGWEDAAQARIARAKAERLAAAQLQGMLDANPSGALGTARLDDPEKLRESGL